MSSESSGEEEDQPGDMIHRRRLKFEEKGVNTDNPSPKKNQQTETEFNKLFMVSKGIQVQQTGKKVGETQTEDKHTYNIFTQTETKLYATNFCQTDVTVSKNSEDFEKLKTVYLKKLKADPIFKSSIENDSSINIDGQSQDIDPNVFQAIQSESKRNIEAYELRRNLEGIESKKNIELPKGSQTSSRNIEILQSMNSNDGKKQSGKDDDSQKFERAQNKKKSSLVSKKSRMSLFSQPTGLKSSSLADQQQQPYLTASQLQQDDKDQVFLDSSFTIEDIDVNSFIFESQKKLFKAILKISENSKFIKLDVKNSKCTQSGYQDAIKELSRQLQILSLQIRMQLDESKATERNLRIEGIDLAMELEEISEMQGRRNKGNQLYLRQQRQIQSIVEDIVLSSENESSPSMSPKRMISTFLEGSARQKNTPNSNSNSYSKLPLNNNNNTNANTFMIKDPFSNHQNVQNAIDMDKERAQQRQGNRKSSRLGSQKFLRGDSMFTQAAQQATTTFNEQPSSIRPKQLSQQLKQQQLTTQLLAAATTPIAGGTGSQTAIGMNNNISNNYLYSSGKKQDVQLRKQLKKLKQAIKNTQNVGIITAIGMDSTTLGKSNQGYGQFNRSVQSLQSEQIYEMVDAIAAIANKKNNNKNTVNVNSESISTKNNVIQIRKMLSIVLSELSRNITQTGGGLSSPLLLLLNNYYLKSTGSQSSAIQKIKALLDRAITVPKSYQEITLFTYLIGLSSEHDYASAEYLNIYLSMLMQLSVNSQQQQQQQSQSQQLSFQALNINYTQIQTTTIKIHKYLPNILQGYLPDKTVYDIVFEILKPYIEENDSEGTNRNTNKGNSSSSGRNSLTNRLFNEQSSQIPQPTLVTLQLQDIIMFVLRKFKEQSSSIITMHVPLFECVTYCDDEEISEQQFKMILKHVGHTDIEKHDYHLFCFKKAAKKTAMIKQNFIGFLNKSFAIDDLRFRDLLESNDPGELNTRDFDSLSGLEIEWPRQRDRMKMCLYEAKIYSSLHRRLIGIVNAYLQNIEKNTFTAKKHFKTQALLAYKLLRSEIKDALMDKVISEYFIPGNIESMIAAWKDIDAKKRFKQIAKKERILKKIGQNNQLKDAEKEKGMEIIGRNKLNGRADSDRSQRSSDSEDNDGDYYSDPDEQEYEEDRKKNLNYNNIEKAQLQQHDRTSITSLAQKILANQK